MRRASLFSAAYMEFLRVSKANCPEPPVQRQRHDVVKKLHQVVDQNRVLRLGNGLSFQLRQKTVGLSMARSLGEKSEVFNLHCSHMAMLRASR